MRYLIVGAGILFLISSPHFSNVSQAEEQLRDLIDQHLQQKWGEKNLTPAPASTDAEFLRRVSLDLIGTIPTLEETRKFLNNPSSKKREALIDQLIEDPRFAQNQADVWDQVLFGRNPPGYQTNQRDGFQDWLKKQFEENTPYNQWAQAILKAEGNSVDHGPPMYFAQYDRNPEDAAVAITQRFLGIQLQCARCHDHPFETWTQVDFYGVAAFFARLRKVTVGKQGRDTKWAIGEMNRGDVLFTGPAIDQQPGQKGKPVPAKFLAGKVLEEPELPESVQDPRNFPNNKIPPAPKFSRKDSFAEWATAPENPYLARAVANRVFGQFFGRGIVHPVDHFSESNPATHPELLKILAEQMQAHNFDLKWYIRELVNSQAYQIASTGDVSEAAPQWFQRARTRPLSAEELINAWRVATHYDAAEPGMKEKHKDDRFYPVTSGYMLRYFGTPSTGEGNFQGGLHEHLYLNNGQVTYLISNKKGSLYDQILNGKEPIEERVETLFLSILNRKPSDAERQKFVEYLSPKGDAREQVKEAMWALMTCSEFRFNH